MIETEIKTAIQWRKNLNLNGDTETLRIFYGPGESTHSELQHIAVDLFLDHAWITQWKVVSDRTIKEVCRALQSDIMKLKAIVLMDRSSVASEADVKTVHGTPAVDRFTVKEFGIPYLIQMSATKHPGLFLDHAPLRKWILRTQKDKTLLNLFSYTGSLSVAAGVAGANQVTTLDLSKSTIDWAKDNWTNAGLDPAKGDFIYGDVFEWLPKMKKRNQTFDTILCDPPSFSRSKTGGTFSTNKDSTRLHEQIFPLLKSGGVLVTSINSENHLEKNFLADIEAAAEKTKTKILILGRVDLPESFPTPANLKDRYLKGFYILKE